ncbi:hypothetical protein [Zhouia amylolytica]|nr:hypothetical protein [Zhouia amylolytica]
MKKLTFLSKTTTLLLFSICLTSCSSTDDSAMENIPDEIDGTSITYENTIKGIMTSECTSCHGSTTSQGAPMSLVTYAQVVDAVDNRNLVGRIESNTNPMPQGGKMSQTKIDQIKAWVANGTPEK